MASHVEINHDLYKWLVQLQILPNTQKYKPSGNYQLQFRIQQQLQCGLLMGKLLSTIAAQKNIALNGPLLSSIKNSNTPAAKVYNWNILSEGFSKIGINLSKERQKQITSGNFDSLVLFLLDIQNKSNQKVFIRLFQKLQKNIPTSNTPELGLDIKKVHKYEEINLSETVLEFILVLISKNLGLNPKQAVATLSESAKYLAHMIVKGIKGSFEQIIQLIDDARSKMDKIIYLAQKDPEKNIQFILNIFKPTLISRDSDVAKAGAFLLKSLFNQSLKYNTKNLVYQVLCKQNQGFDFIYMGLKRHPYLNYEIFDAIKPLVQGAFKDFFDIQLKRTINNQQQYIKTLVLILQPLMENKEAKSEIFTNGLFQQWQKSLDTVSQSKIKSKEIAALTDQTKYQNIQLVYTLFLGYYKQLEPPHAQQLLIKLTQQLKKNTRSESYTIRIPSLLKIFNILEFLAMNKNKLAALLYKKIIFLFVQNHNEEQMRQIVLENLTIVIRRFPTIPLEFLLEPMLRQLTSKQGTSYILNMYDFEFIIQLCKHPKMEQFYAMTFLDYFVQLYIKSVIYSSLIFRIIQAITARFCQSEQIREFCLRATQICLNNYGMLVMGKSKGNKAHYYQQKGQNKQQLIINNQKKSLIIELIKHFISLQHKELTSEIKQTVASLFVEWYQNRNHYDKGLAAILMQMGDIQDILVEYKQKQINNLRNESKQSMEKDQTSQSNQFHPKSLESGRTRKTDNKYLLAYQNEVYGQQKSSPNIQDIGLGYKKKRHDIPNKYQLLNSKSRNIKPDPKVLEDLEKIKQKWKMDQSRAKLEQQQAKKDRIGKINQLQLLQRNLSLGYTKLPELTSGQILFDFDTVKRKHLKDSLDLINIETQQQRQLETFLNIIQRYQKYIKSLFINYASKSGPLSQDKQLNILSFTQIMRLLKDKGLITRIPKIAINQIITTINQKRKKQRNVLGGVYQQDFPTFILYLTDLILQQDMQNKKDEPFGLKIQKVILKMLEGQKNTKQLFDPKLQKIKEDLYFNQNTQIPQDFKKVKEMQIDLDYNLHLEDSNIDQPFLDCFEILDGLVYEAVGVNIISPFTKFKQKFNLVRIFKPIVSKAQSQSMDKKLDKIDRSGTQQAQNHNGSLLIKKDILADSQNSFTKPLRKLSKNLIKKKSQSQRNVAAQAVNQAEQNQKDKKRQIHAKKLKEQILKMRQQKLKIQNQHKQKQKTEQQKIKRKQELHKQYLEENKKKLKQKKEEDQKKAKQAQQKEQQMKQKRKVQIKAKQIQLLEKQRKAIEAKRQKAIQKQKVKQLKQKQTEKFVRNKSNDKLINQMKVSANDQKMKDLLIKNSMQNGQLKEMIQKNKKNFEQLFEVYWNWEKQKMELKNLAQMFKDLQTTKYVLPKNIADVYKNVARGQLLSLQNFIQCIVRLSYKSQQILEQLEKSKVQQINKQPGEDKKLPTAPFGFMLKLLKMNEANYKQTVIRIKNEKQMK